MNRFFPKIFWGSALFLAPFFVSATSYSVDIYAAVEGCGDEIIQGGEQCDGTNLGGATCESLGFDAGAVQCSTACTFITASCILNPPSSGGGTKVQQTEQLPSNTNIVVFGEAVPLSTVSLLKDGQRVATVPVPASGIFQITIAGLSGGTYRLAVVGEKVGFSPVVSEVVAVRGLKGATTKVGSITLPPYTNFTNEHNKITVHGYAPARSVVSLLIDGSMTQSAAPQSDGTFEFIFDGKKDGSAVIQVKNTSGVTTVSVPYVFQDSSSLPLAVETCSLKGDINGDCRVGPVDFFISRFRFVQSLFSSRFDFNNDGEISIVDFSIMAFYWNG
jgi:hypothetical protein